MGREMLKSIRQERRKTRRRHFTAAHGKGAVVNLTFAADITVDGDVVRRVGENQTSFAAAEQIVVRSALKRIATKDAVRTQQPEVIGLGNGRSGCGDIIITVPVRFLGRRGVQNDIDVGRLKTRKFDLKAIGLQVL
jgi:hypothetical protein